MKRGATKAFIEEGGVHEEEAFAVAFWLQMVGLAVLEATKGKAGGSVPGRAPNVQRDYAAAHTHYMLKYFWPRGETRPGTSQKGPEQPESAFERRFRMPRSVFNRVLTAVVSSSEYFRKGLRPDASGRIGITPLLKLVCALRQMAYATPCDLADDLFDVSETTASLCLEEFCSKVVDLFCCAYLREPSANDLRRVERQFAKVGFPGCIGCLDCAGWAWKNCPKAFQGVMTGKEGKPTLRMEVICDLDLWIWSFQFGLPGVLNDLSILEVSQHFSRVLSGEFPAVRPSYVVNGQVFDWFYYLTDGIYPQCKVFVKTASEGTTGKTKLFCAFQEGVRKCVERVFGVLFRQYKVLFVASELWTKSRMKTTAQSAVILHNMTVEVRRSSYTSDGAGGASDRFYMHEDETDIVLESVNESEVLAMQAGINVGDDIKVKGYHHRLMSALIEHIWSLHGKSVD